MRLLILLAVAYLAFRLLRSWLGPGKTTAYNGRGAGRIDDEMVQDPFCHIYFPRRSAVSLNHNGREVFFCSAHCRDHFLEANGKGQAEDKRSV